MRRAAPFFRAPAFFSPARSKGSHCGDGVAGEPHDGGGNADGAGRFPACSSRRLTEAQRVLAPLPHPTQLETVTFRGEPWRRAMCQLYRVIFKLHQSRLLPMQREFGDRFVQVEFQRHMDASEKHARIFYQSWYGYVAQLEAGQTSRELTEEELRQLTPEQKEKLRELRGHVMQVRQTDSDFVL
ncbi:uncharacterized protein Tco025E_06347 [Trypanosoma conorhini]|uniref:Succinate dehydrogenase assembly factor 3 n=1 Tax=Trypanosoma conorhini TaxID=83891 RepID=A0A422P6G4_9TRYP|nr:uncharacterized protein Tco025E_06347 [Trypanosoma conorhini]RNF13317.1 hypothetical protein Tco025E_06347 [Trypanosoma conorhini]